MMISSQYWQNLFYGGLPIWIVFFGGLLCLFVDSLNLRKGAPVVFFLGVAVLVAALVAAARQWMSGIDRSVDLITMDPLSLFFLMLALFVGILSLFNAYSYLKVLQADEIEKPHAALARGPYAHQFRSVSSLPGGFVTLLLLSIVGQIFLFASDHMIVNFIGLETMSLAVYILVGSNRSDVRSSEASMKYFVMGSVASALLLYGVALLYGSFNTFHLSQIAPINALNPGVKIPFVAVALIFSGVFFKLSLVPFHFWTPDAYEGAPSPVTGFMATGVKAATFGFLIRILASLNFIPGESLHQILTILVVATLVVGNLGAIVQTNVKRMLAYSSIAHAGYMFLGLLAGLRDGHFDAQATSAVLYYLIGYSFMTLGAFAVLSVMVQDKKEVTQLTDLIGLGTKRPFLAAAFSLFMISLLGFPPTVGFTAKYGIFSYAVQQGHVALAIFGVLTSLISAYYYLWPLVMMYFKGEAQKDSIREVPFPLMFSLVFCVVSVLYLGFKPADYVRFAEIAAQIIK